MENGIYITFRSRDMLESTPVDLRHDISMTYHNEDPDSNIDEIIHGVYALLIGNTFSKTTIINGMKRFIEENEDTQTQGQEL